MSTERTTILIVEDDDAIASILDIELTEAGYGVVRSAEGHAALASLDDVGPDLVLLDVRLPDMDGLSVCRQMRRNGLTAPVIMLTALDRVGDRVLGLESGADDYLSKPFAIEELIARIRAFLRRSRGTATLQVGDVRINAETRAVTVNDGPVDLSVREFDLLAFLAAAPGRVFTREQIYEGVWGYTYPGRTKVIDFFISSLRKKLGKPGDTLIRTVRGLGYSIRP